MATFSPTTETHIANMALSRLGEKEISDIDSDTTRAAEACERHFGQCRDEVLSEHFWNFAQRRTTLRYIDPDEEGTPTDPGADDQVVNGQFNTDLTPWTDQSGGSAAAAWDANMQAAKLTGTAANDAVLRQEIATFPNNTSIYALRFEIIPDAVENTQIKLDLTDDNGANSMLSESFGPGQHVVQFTNATGANGLRIDFTNELANSAWVDNVSLIREDVVNTFQWANAFWLPGDLFRFIRTYPRDIDYQIEGQYLLSDHNHVSIFYTARLANPSKWTSDFKELVSLKLAHRIGRDLRGSSELLAEITSEYANKLADAMYRDAQAQAPREMGGLTHLYAHWGADEPFRRIENT